MSHYLPLALAGLLAALVHPSHGDTSHSLAGSMGHVRRLAPEGFLDVGQTLFGSPSSDNITYVEFGSTVTLSSADGSRLAVGAPLHDWTTPSNHDLNALPNEDGGGIYLYDNDGSNWNLLWFLHGDAGEKLGNRVSLTADGSRVAVRRYNTNPSSVEVYDIGLDGTATLVGAPIVGSFNGDTVTLSPEGTRVALTYESYSSYTGRVEIFELIGGVWSSMGSFDGVDSQDRFGWITAFSDSGNRLAISSPNYDGGLTKRGLVRVFDYDTVTGVWSQTGGDLEGASDSESLGFSMDLSGDGSTLAVGSPGSDGAPNGITTGELRGKIGMYRLISGNWVLHGDEIEGSVDRDRFGRSVAISNDGSRVAASSYFHDGQRGHVRLFDMDEGAWAQVGDAIDGDTKIDRFGYGILSVTMTGDGMRLASGSVWAYNLEGFRTGSVRVFDEGSLPSSTPSFSPSAKPSSVPTSSPTSSPTRNPTPFPTLIPTSSPTSSPTVMGSNAPSNTITSPPTSVPTASLVSSSPSMSPSQSVPVPLSPTTGADLNKFSWTIERVGGAIVAFEDESSPEVQLQYNISRRDTRVVVYEVDCLTEVPSNIVAASQSLSPTSPSHGMLTVDLDIKQDSIKSSPIWTENSSETGQIDVCVRLDLLLGDAAETSVHFHETQLSITIDMTAGFQAIGLDLDREAAVTVTETAALDYEIFACQCDASLICSSELLTQGSDVYICVETNATDVDMIGVESLNFIQGNFASSPIVDGAENQLTAVTCEGSQCRIRSQMPSAFFEFENPEDVLADGVVVLSFGGRRQLRHRVKVTPQQPRTLKEAEDEGMIGFDVSLGLKSSKDATSSAAAKRMASVVLLAGTFMFI